MKMKQFVQKISNACQQIKSVADNNEIINLSSKILANDLNELIKQHIDSEEEVTARNVQAFCDILTKRFELIQNTSLEYFINMGPDNEKCWVLASLLAPITGKHFLQLLIPTLKMDTKDLPDLYFNEARTRDFFISEQSNSLIRRSAVLHYAAIKKGMLASTYEAKKRELTPIEEKMVIHYNQQAKNFYNQIIRQKNLKKVKKDYLETLMGSKQEPVLSGYGYGQEGEKKLQLRVLQASETFAGFVSGMVNYVDPSHWKFIIKKIDVKILIKLALDINGPVSEEVLEKKLKEVAFSDPNSQVNKIIGLTALIIYWKGLRSQQAEYKSFIGSIFGRWVAYSKEDKKEAVKVGVEFLTSNLPLTMASLDEFLKEQGKGNIKGALLEEGSILGLIFKKLLITANIQAHTISAPLVLEEQLVGDNVLRNKLI